MPETYPDVELALMEILAPIARTVTVLVNWPDEDLPAIRVARVGGGDGEEMTDEAIVLVRCYAMHHEGAPRASQDLARQVRVRLKDVAGEFAAGTLIDRAVKQNGPVTSPVAEAAQHPDRSVRVTELIYRVFVRD